MATNDQARRHPGETPFSVGHLNAWRLNRQWLDRPFEGRSLLELIRATGWLYSPGCSTPYLSLWARTSGFVPRSLDRLVFREQKLVQLETLRGCTMLVPRDQAAVALRVRNRAFMELAKQAKSLMPVTEKELERLKRAVVETLESGPADHAEIATAVPSELVRTFPPGLQRVGLTGSLWLAINLLKEEGRVVKIQTGKRLDNTEYRFALVSNVLPEVDPFALDGDRANVQLAAHYFEVEGPARIRDFAWWAGLNVTEAIRAAGAVEPALETIRVEGSDDQFLMTRSVAESFRGFRAPAAGKVNLIPYRDTYLKGQREVVNRFVRDEHFDKPFSRWKGKIINDPLATILHNGQVVGLWEWSAEENLDFVLFDHVSRELETRVRARADELGTFIRKKLGAVRLQGLDYRKNQMTGIHELRSYWGQGPQASIPS